MDSGNLALGLLSGLSFLLAGWVLVSHRDMKRMENRLRIHGEDILELRRSSLTLATLRNELESVNRNAEASNNLLGCVLAERIDALSARLDAVELACGLREKPKTMGGAR